ncbi:titin homolog isoform X2 [Clytia hemisphaerica]|uniref:titin homolog isoform X2 n=1 Tax=Clytia hemisphaerica TaxID=252671 RepID=UPI0034D3C2C5
MKQYFVYILWIYLFFLLIIFDMLQNFYDMARKRVRRKPKKSKQNPESQPNPEIPKDSSETTKSDENPTANTLENTNDVPNTNEDTQKEHDQTRPTQSSTTNAQKPTQTGAQPPMQKAAKQPAQPATQQAVNVKQPTQLTAQQTTQPAAQKSIKQPTQSTTRQPTQPVAKQSLQQAAQQPTLIATRQAAKQPIQSTNRQPTQPVVQQPLQHATEQAVKQPTQSTTQQPTQKATQQPTQPADKQTSQKATQQPTPTATQQATKKPTRSTDKNIAESIERIGAALRQRQQIESISAQNTTEPPQGSSGATQRMPHIQPQQRLSAQPGLFPPPSDKFSSPPVLSLPSQEASPQQGATVLPHDATDSPQKTPAPPTAARNLPVSQHRKFMPWPQMTPDRQPFPQTSPTSLPQSPSVNSQPAKTLLKRPLVQTQENPTAPQQTTAVSPQQRVQRRTLPQTLLPQTNAATRQNVKRQRDHPSFMSPNSQENIPAPAPNEPTEKSRKPISSLTPTESKAKTTNSQTKQMTMNERQNTEKVQNKEWEEFKNKILLSAKDNEHVLQSHKDNLREQLCEEYAPPSKKPVTQSSELLSKDEKPKDIQPMCLIVGKDLALPVKVEKKKPKDKSQSNENDGLQKFREHLKNNEEHIQNLEAELQDLDSIMANYEDDQNQEKEVNMGDDEDSLSADSSVHEEQTLSRLDKILLENRKVRKEQQHETGSEQLNTIRREIEQMRCQMNEYDNQFHRQPGSIEKNLDEAAALSRHIMEPTSLPEIQFKCQTVSSCQPDEPCLDESPVKRPERKSFSPETTFYNLREYGVIPERYNFPGCPDKALTPSRELVHFPSIDFNTPLTCFTEFQDIEEETLSRDVMKEALSNELLQVITQTSQEANSPEELPRIASSTLLSDFLSRSSLTLNDSRPAGGDFGAVGQRPSNDKEEERPNTLEIENVEQAKPDSPVENIDQSRTDIPGENIEQSRSDIPGGNVEHVISRSPEKDENEENEVENEAERVIYREEIFYGDEDQSIDYTPVLCNYISGEESLSQETCDSEQDTAIDAEPFQDDNDEPKEQWDEEEAEVYEEPPQRQRQTEIEPEQPISLDPTLWPELISDYPPIKKTKAPEKRAQPAIDDHKEDQSRAEYRKNVHQSMNFVMPTPKATRDEHPKQSPQKKAERKRGNIDSFFLPVEKKGSPVKLPPAAPSHNTTRIPYCNLSKEGDEKGAMVLYLTTNKKEKEKTEGNVSTSSQQQQVPESLPPQTTPKKKTNKPDKEEKKKKNKKQKKKEKELNTPVKPFMKTHKTDEDQPAAITPKRPRQPSDQEWLSPSLDIARNKRSEESEMRRRLGRLSTFRGPKYNEHANEVAAIYQEKHPDTIMNFNTCLTKGNRTDIHQSVKEINPRNTPEVQSFHITIRRCLANHNFPQLCTDAKSERVGLLNILKKSCKVLNDRFKGQSSPLTFHDEHLADLLRKGVIKPEEQSEETAYSATYKGQGGRVLVLLNYIEHYRIIVSTRKGDLKRSFSEAQSIVCSIEQVLTPKNLSYALHKKLGYVNPTSIGHAFNCHVEVTFQCLEDKDVCKFLNEEGFDVVQITYNKRSKKYVYLITNTKEFQQELKAMKSMDYIIQKLRKIENEFEEGYPYYHELLVPENDA